VLYSCYFVYTKCFLTSYSVLNSLAGNCERHLMVIVHDTFGDLQEVCYTAATVFTQNIF